MSVISKLGTDTFTSYASAAVWSFNWTHTLVAGSNRIVIIGCGGETTLADSSPIWYATSVTYGGVAMTQAARAETTETASGYSNNSSELWYILEADLPSNGLQTVQVNGTGPNSTVELFGTCTEYENVFQGPPHATDSNFVNAVAPSDTITNTISPAKGSIVRSSYVCGNVGTWTVSGSQVELYDASQTTTSFGACELVGALGTETSLSSTYVSGANRLTRVAASFRKLPWKINTVSSAGDVGEVNTVALQDIGKINTYIT